MRRKSFSRKAALGAALALAATAPAGAADLATKAQVAPPPIPVATADTPTFLFTGYLWASAMSGQTGTLPPLPPVNVDMSFGDILKQFDGGIMGAGEMRVGRWGFLADVMFLQVSPSASLPGPYAGNLEIRSRSLTLQGDVLYRLYEAAGTSVDVGAGLRYWLLGNRLSFDNASPLPSFSYSETEGWVDPLIVGRFTTPLGGDWSLTVVGDIGGFDVGSRLTYQAIGTVNYQWTRQLALRAGYRYLSVDYSSGKFLYDVQLQGPVIGATYRF
ncbi:hypothetical protein J5J86_06905 [Aquabacter sp. L1I39]|uniref:hypothetical protein n=1 Tax=Aquabacter sp. L1I39 TaxID=2820278 RepID=UPI001ADC2EBD|nr:hypothetical protein [Aquabacter sp. L1I39]QTL05028.1 hypothetical protein J5J86_06905 [Aquabacter sp. L1I39]